MCESMGIKTGFDIPRLLDVGRGFVKNFLDITPAQRQTLIANVSPYTGIAAERLGRLGGDQSELESMKEEAAKYVIKPGEEKPEWVRRKVNMSLDSLVGYLKMRRWGYARSETIVAGPPPSPYLQHLL